MAVLDLIGGIGLFLLGIVLFMESLRSVAGDSMQRRLARLTGTPLRAMGTGAGLTSVIQSAHATIVIAMGLAGAGILTGVQALAILIGANIGTTVTAWLVALLGLRIGFGPIAGVLVAAGALMRLTFAGRWGRIGHVMAAFGLLFVGIDALAHGLGSMPAFESRDGIPLLILAGILAAVITQSSSVTVAATITAVFAGTLRLEDAAWLVIGQNLGTTSTIILVALGSSAAGKRLAAGHVIINGTTAVLVAALFSPLLWFSQSASASLGGQDALALAIFHTAFNVLGAVVFMPLVRPLAGKLAKVFPDTGPQIVLDPLAARVPAVAAQAVRRATADVAAELCSVLLSRSEHGVLPHGTLGRVRQAQSSLVQIENFLATTAPASDSHHQQVRLVHALERVRNVSEEGSQAPLRQAALRSVALGSMQQRFRQALLDAKAWFQTDLEADPEDALASLEAVRSSEKEDRARVLEEAAGGKAMLHDALAQVQAMEWMARQSHHLARVAALLAPDGEGMRGKEEAA